MKKILIITFSLLITLFSFAQNKSKKVKIKWGQIQNESKKSELENIVGYDNTGVYVVKGKKGILSLEFDSRTIEHYNNKMFKMKSKELNFLKNGKKLKLQFFLHINNVLYMFSSLKDSDSKKDILYSQQVNKKTLSTNREYNKIVEVAWNKYDRMTKGEYNVELSTDSSKILIYYNLSSAERENEEIGFSVFDNNMNMLWEKTIEFSYDKKLFDIHEITIDNKGDVFLIAKEYINKRIDKKDGKPNYNFHVFNYYNNGNDFTDYPLKLKDYFITDFQIKINDNGEILCGGFYSKKGKAVLSSVSDIFKYSLSIESKRAKAAKEKAHNIKGSFLIKINTNTKEITASDSYEFDIKFIRKWKNILFEEAKLNKDNTELRQYDLKDIILTDEGNIIIVGEQSYEITTKVQGFSSTTYYYNDIIVTKISPEGAVKWVRRLPKRQATSQDYGKWSSYSLFEANNKLYFIFNDNPKNLQEKYKNNIKNFNKDTKTITVLIEIDSEGEVSREVLFSSKEIGVLLEPKVCYQISDNEMILFGKRKKKQRFGKLTFK